MDDNKIRNNKNIEEIEILSLDEAIREKGNFIILITNYYVESVLKRIEDNHFDLRNVFFLSELLIEDIDRQYIKMNEKFIKQSFEYLSDYQSKMIFRTMIEARFTKNTDLLSRTCQKNQYFPKDIFSFDQNEVFLDGGAFDGDTINQFIKNTNYKYIYAFEPDSENYKKLKRNNYDKNIIMYNAGLWNETTKLNFGGNQGGSSKIEEKGSDFIQVYRFDDIEIPDDRITFIKMDIEGSELKALKGMKRTIKRCKPKLAICIYHKFEDLWELPLYIKSLVPEYKLYIRNYTTYLDEIVLYATI